MRANIQTLEDADRLPPGEQARLREDIVEELDELTALVGDVVELARGSQTPSQRRTCASTRSSPGRSTARVGVAR